MGRISHGCEGAWMDVFGYYDIYIYIVIYIYIYTNTYVCVYMCVFVCFATQVSQPLKQLEFSFCIQHTFDATKGDIQKEKRKKKPASSQIICIFFFFFSLCIQIVP